MKKAVISNRIYLSCDDKFRKELSDELTYKIPTYNPLDPPEIIKNVGYINDSLVTIPVGRTDLIPDDYEIKDKRVLKPVYFPEFKFELMEGQQEVYDEVDDNCIINAKVSWGKTFTAIAIACKLGQKTLVVVHTSNLRDQWVAEVEKAIGIKPGVIGGGKENLNAPIVIGTVQSLYRRIDLIKKEFGTLILDEMHHVSSRTFSSIIDSSYARYKIGLSGTIIRKDGKHVIFADYFGHKLFQPPEANSMTPKTHIIRTEIRFPDGKQPWALRVNKLVENEEYQHLVAMLASTYAAMGHKVLVVSDRVYFLKKCAELSGDRAMHITGEIKETKERNRLIELIPSGEKDILYGTQAIFSEGTSVNQLSCLILGTPVNNEPLLEQLIGRIKRKCKGKKQPIIVDIHLKGNTARNQASNRMGHYIKEGYDIEEF